MGERGNLLLKTAKYWLGLGVSVVPAWPRSKVVNLQWRRFETELPGEQLLKSWFEPGLSNLALVCGTGRADLGRLLVLDFDDLDHALEFGHKAGSLYKTYTESTGRGLHLFYLVDTPITRKFREAESLGTGHLCLASPSVHPSGTVYKTICPNCTQIARVETSTLFSLLSEIKSVEFTRSSPGSSLPVPGGSVDTITRIKAFYSIAEFAAELVELKPSGRGRYLLGRCPFHEDIHPSFWVDVSKGLWGCFAASCKANKGGDVINLYALAKGVTVREAIRRMAEGLP